MNLPYFSVGAAILYFGWLWQGRSGADRSTDGSSDRTAKKSKRTGKIPVLQPASVERVTTKVFNPEDGSTSVAQGVAQ